MNGPTALLALAPLQAPADTVVTLAARDGYDVLLAVAAGIFAMVFLVLLAGLLFVFFQIHRGITAAGKAKDRIARDPGVESLRKTSANVEAISHVLRGEVEELSRSVRNLSDRLTQASDRMEERIEDFNALMEVMQAEAENAFVDTASTARGVRRGIGALQADGRRRRNGPQAPGSVEAVAAGGADAVAPEAGAPEAIPDPNAPEPPRPHTLIERER
jgi:hypothetical protein